MSYMHICVFIFIPYLQGIHLYLIESVYFLPLQNQAVPFWGGTAPSGIHGEIPEKAIVLTGAHAPPPTFCPFPSSAAGRGVPP